MRLILKIFNLKESEFVKNAFILTLGTGVGQFITLLASPLLTRLYSPLEFGLYAVFMAISGILFIVSTGQYELAITLPKKGSTSNQLVFLIWIIGLVLSILLFVLLTINKDLFLNSFRLTSSPLIVYLIPFTTLVFSFYQPTYYLAIRSKAFKPLAIASVLNVLITLILQILLFFTLLKPYGLILPYSISTLLVLIFLVVSLSRKGLLIITLDKDLISILKTLIKRYRNFPIFTLPALLINVSANQIPNILMNSLFSTSIAGYYALTNKVLGSPASLISQSILDVFKERASRDYRETGSCRIIFLKTFKALLFISIIPFLLIYALSPTLFPIIFGGQWSEAGKYVQILSILFFFRFTISPLTYVFIIAEKQKINFILQVLLLIITVASINLGYFNKNIYLSLTMFSLGYSFWYLINFALSYKYSSTSSS